MRLFFSWKRWFSVGFSIWSKWTDSFGIGILSTFAWCKGRPIAMKVWVKFAILFWLIKRCLFRCYFWWRAWLFNSSFDILFLIKLTLIKFSGLLFPRDSYWFFVNFWNIFIPIEDRLKNSWQRKEVDIALTLTFRWKMKFNSVEHLLGLNTRWHTFCFKLAKLCTAFISPCSINFFKAKCSFWSSVIFLSRRGTE